MADGMQAGAGGAADRAGNLVGYARVSTRDQTVALQLDALHAARCGRVFEETASGAQRDRPQLAAALDYMRAGDTVQGVAFDALPPPAGRARRGGRHDGRACLTRRTLDTAGREVSEHE